MLMYAYINFKLKWLYNQFFCIKTASRLVDLHGNSGRKRRGIPGHFGWKKPIAFGKTRIGIEDAVAAIEGCNEVFHAGLSAGILYLYMYMYISVMLSFLIFDSRPPHD